MKPFEEIRQRAPLREVLEQAGFIPDRSGKICCPFHGEKTPSFGIDKKRNRFHCFGCGWDGSAIDFVMQTDGKTAFEAAQYLNETFKLGVIFENNFEKYARERAKDKRLREEFEGYKGLISYGLAQAYDEDADRLAEEAQREHAKRKAAAVRNILENDILYGWEYNEDDPEGTVERMREAVSAVVGFKETDAIRYTYHPEEREDLPEAVDLDAIPDEDESKYLWFPYVPMQEVTILAAPGGTGKGMLFTLMAARLSTGTGFRDMEYECCPDHQRALQDGEKAVTLIISKEDGAKRIKPRFLISGGFTPYLKIIDDTLYDRNKKEFLMRLNVGTDEGCAELEKWIRKYNPKLVILDPITSFMSGKRLNNGDDARTVLSNLTRLARITDTAIIAVTHTRKGSKDDAAMTDLIAGSHEIKDVARSVLMIGYDIEDDRTLDEFDYHTPRRLMYHVKTNHASIGRTVRYYIHEGKNKQGGGRFPTSESGFGSFSEVTAEVLERTPHGTLPGLYWKRLKAEREARRNNMPTISSQLWTALDKTMEMMNDAGMTAYSVSYDEFNAEHKENETGSIWRGKPSEDLTAAVPLLMKHGFTVQTGVKVDRNSKRGFTLLKLLQNNQE